MSLLIELQIEIMRAVTKATNRPTKISPITGKALLEFMPTRSVAIDDNTTYKSTGILMLLNQIRLVTVVWVTSKNVAISRDIKNAGICLIIASCP